VKARLLITVASLAAVLAGCGTSTMMAPSVPMAAQPAVQAESFKGIGQALARQVERKFYEKDANRNKKITPEEWGIKTAEDFVDFREADDNKDGTVELKEMLPGFFDKFSAYRHIKKASRFMFAQLDKNGDKKLTQGEASEITMAGVADKWSKFAGGKTKAMNKSQFDDFFAELMLNGDAPLKPGAKPPAPPAPPAGGDAPAPAPAPAI
jgi:hypothetical protein